MSKRDKDDSKQDPAKRVPQGRDVVDGIPDRSARSPVWAYLLLAAVFLAWLAFLVYCQFGGRPD